MSSNLQEEQSKFEFIEPKEYFYDVEFVDGSQIRDLKLTQGLEIKDEFPVVELRVSNNINIPNFFFCGVMLIVSEGFIRVIKGLSINGQIFPVSVCDHDGNAKGGFYYMHLFRGERGVNCFDFDKSDCRTVGRRMIIDAAEIDQSKVPDGVDVARIDGIKILKVIASEALRNKVLSSGVLDVVFSKSLVQKT